MAKKNDQKLCWNCDGSISLQLEICPYCGADLARPQNTALKDPPSPWQTATVQKEVPPPPYTGSTSAADFSISQEEWKRTLEEKPSNEVKKEEPSGRGEMIALLLLLPGVVFFLFGIVLLLFAREGFLTIRWNGNFALFYLVGSLPLLFLGWRSLK